VNRLRRDQAAEQQFFPKPTGWASQGDRLAVNKLISIKASDISLAALSGRKGEPAMLPSVATTQGHPDPSGNHLAMRSPMRMRKLLQLVDMT